MEHELTGSEARAIRGNNLCIEQIHRVYPLPLKNGAHWGRQFTDDDHSHSGRQQVNDTADT
jgi:hypothetical protein